MNQELEERIIELVRGECLAGEYEIFSLRVRRTGNRQIVSMAIDHPDGGITLEECARWNRVLGRSIEEAGILAGPYVTEVASPGIDWPLRVEKDFRRLTGRRIRIRIRTECGGVTLESGGTLRKAAEGRLVIETADAEGGRLEVRIADVVAAEAEIFSDRMNGA